MDYGKLSLCNSEVSVEFKPDSILPEESTLVFTRTRKTGFFKKTIITDTAIVNLKGVEITCQGFEEEELASLIHYTKQNSQRCYDMMRKD